jgi:hypothetical protein
MTIDAWRRSAIADAERRGVPELVPLLEALARATATLRDADFNDRADGRGQQRGVHAPPAASGSSGAPDPPHAS